MSSQFGVEKCGGEGSEAAGGAAVIGSLTSDMSLELKSSPKKTCIPLNQHHRVVSSATSVTSKMHSIDVPEKSWSVLYTGAKKDDN